MIYSKKKPKSLKIAISRSNLKISINKKLRFEEFTQGSLMPKNQPPTSKTVTCREDTDRQTDTQTDRDSKYRRTYRIFLVIFFLIFYRWAVQYWHPCNWRRSTVFLFVNNVSISTFRLILSFKLIHQRVCEIFFEKERKQTRLRRSDLALKEYFKIYYLSFCKISG